MIDNGVNHQNFSCYQSLTLALKPFVNYINKKDKWNDDNYINQKIEEIDEQREYDFKLHVNSQIELIQLAPFNDPMYLSVNGCRLSIRRDTAQYISICK